MPLSNQEILESHVFNSVSTEEQIANILRNLKWETIHSFYFTDCETKKTRETDIIAEKIWLDQNKTHLPIKAKLRIVTEVKSIKDYHILFSSNSPRSEEHLIPFEIDYWLGNEAPQFHELCKTLIKLNLPPEDINEILKKANNLAYPNGARIKNFRCPPLPLPITCTSFREFKLDKNNKETEKDPEVSVLWKATQTVKSAIAATKTHFQYGIIKDFEHESYHHFTFQQLKAKTFNPLTFYRLNFLLLFHPVVILEAKLWLKTKENIKNIPYTRLLFAGNNYLKTDWVDVVHIEHAEEFFKKLNKYYEKFFSKQLKTNYRK